MPGVVAQSGGDLPEWALPYGLTSTLPSMPEAHRVNTPRATGTVTLLFTDIEGSTALWEQDGARMSQALAAHDGLARRAVESRQGTVVKMTGDGMHAAFDDAWDALAATVDLQEALADPAATNGVPLRVRCGLHAGVVERRDNDYFGSPVNRAARIMSAAHGGQVLLSQAVVDCVHGNLPGAVSLRDLGKVRLKDLSTPERVYQVVHPQLRKDFPALRSLEATPNNLPQQATSFIGREEEFADLTRLLAKTRLLTLTGSGGCGKTRLSLQLAADALEQFPDGAWLVELAPLADPGLVPQTAATMLGLTEEPGKPIGQTLTDYLKDKRLLLLLDNCEHLLDGCAKVADGILRQCPGVQILASSREALGIRGEQAYRVPSLSLPDPKQAYAPEAVAQFEAVQLFTDRALLARADFAVTDHNASTLASICFRLDGIPLAIELAAARVRSLSVEEINRKLDERFRLLTGGSRTALPRQQTLRSLIDWSYDLLNDSEKRLLQRLTVFASGWTLDAAEEVCAGDPVEEGGVLDLLTSLVDKSLVLAEQNVGSYRYRLLETVRQYARDRLLEHADGGRWRDRHLTHFLQLTERAELHLTDMEQQTWFDRLETEHENLRAALTWSSAEGGDNASGLRLAGALWRFWSVRGYPGEGRSWLSGLLATAREATPASRAKALGAAGVLAHEQGDNVTARALHAESLEIRRVLGDRQGIASSLSNLGSVAHELGDYQGARALQEESLAMRREAGDRQGIATSLNNLGLLARELGDYPSARRLYEESLAIDRELGDRRSIAVSLNNLGGIACDQCDYAAAQALHEESLAIRRDLGNRRGIASSLTNLGDVAREQGDYAAAKALLEEGLAIRRELGDRRGIAISLCALGSVAQDQGDLSVAQALNEESLNIRRALGDRWGIATSLNYLGSVACEQDNPPIARAMYEESLTIARGLGDRWGIAESMAGLGCVALMLAGPVRAARILGRAERLREEIGAPLKPSERPRYDRQVAAARVALRDDAAFDRAWQEGRALALEQAIELALEKTVERG